MNGSSPSATGTSTPICLIGLGNTLRSDDGLGHYVCRRIRELAGDKADTFFFQQLTTDLLEDFLVYDCIIVADASVEGPPYTFYRAATDATSLPTGVHQGDAGLLQVLARQLYNRNLPVYLCSIRGMNFDFGELLSEPAQTAAEAAVSQLLEFIRSYPLRSAPPDSGHSHPDP